MSAVLPSGAAQPTAFGGRLRMLRERAGLTQEEVAERAALSAHAVSALERGRRTRPYPHTVRALAQALALSDRDTADLLAAVSRRPGTDPADEVGRQVAALPSLPAPATPLLGRAEERAALLDLVVHSQRRLVTLTGTGGVGKTRLALALAEEAAPAFPDGVVLVPLASVTDPALVRPAIARAVGSTVPAGPDAGDPIVEHLRPLRLLLVLDNLEHLLAAAEQVAALVAACPDLAVLVTSRAPLRVRGEVEFPVPPLALPDEDLPELDAVPAPPAIPLALELAAARVRFLDATALLARLDDAMARGGGPDLPERQQTMRATLDWSYELLPEPERRLLRACSVFVGGGSLEAVEAVAGPGSDVLAELEVLVEHSLVVVSSDEEGVPRYGMLEPVAQYARGLLTDEEGVEVRTAHAAHYLAVAERASPEYRGADQVAWLDRTEREDGNLTAALAWLLESGDAEQAGRLGWALWLYWWLRGRLSAGRRAMEQALESEMSVPVRTGALLAAATMSFAMGDLPAAARWWDEAVVASGQWGDRLAQSYSIGGQGLVALATGDVQAAERAFLRALPLADGGGIGGDWMQSLTHVWLGTVRLLHGDLPGAEEHMQRGLRQARRRGDRLAIYVALFNLGQVAITRGDAAAARSHLHEGIRLSEQTRDLANLAYFLEALAVAEAVSAEPERVAVLLGAAETLRSAVGGQVYGYYQPDEALRLRAAADACAALGDDAYGDAVDAGRALTPPEAMAYALTGPAPALLD